MTDIAIEATPTPTPMQTDAQPAQQSQGARDYTLVTQVKCNRVVYFTDDPDYVPAMDGDWYYVSSYRGTLPKEMNLSNCWRWRFNGGVFIDAGGKQPKPRQQALIEHNRLALQQILREKVDLMRAPYAPTCKLGTLARSAKLAEARAYLAAPGEHAAYPLLEALAVGRDLSLQEAAQLIVARAAETDRVLLETESIREKFSHAIQKADTEETLLELRERLLDEVLPALTKHFKFKVPHTEPPKLDEALPQTQLRHEQVRLQVKLREKINQQRSTCISQYLLDHVMVKRKARLAEAVLANGGQLPEQPDADVLQGYADARAMSLVKAANEILYELDASERLLEETEKAKDRMLTHIAAITTLRDIKRVAADIDAL